MGTKCTLLVILLYHSTTLIRGQFTPTSSNNPFLNNDNNNQQQTPRDFNNQFNNLNNNNNNNNNSPFPQQRDRDRDRLGGQDVNRDRDRDRFGDNRDRDFTPFDGSGSFNSFPSQPITPRQESFNPFIPRRDFNNPFGGGNNQRFDISDGSYFAGNEVAKQCPRDWFLFPPNQSGQSPQQACYKFVKTPMHSRIEAQRTCQAHMSGSDLMSLNNLEEHSWIVRKLLATDRQHRSWYISTRQSSPGLWTNADGTPLINMDEAFLQDQLPILNYNFGEVYNYLAYNFSDRRSMWGLLKVSGQESLQYICEVPLTQVPYIQVDNRDFEYGIEITDPKKIPRGPYFIKDPKSEVFDISRGIPLSYVTLTCVAYGWPAPTYQWYKEEYKNNTLIPFRIDPLRNPKYTVSGGSLVIHEPKQTDDRGNYHCVASNVYGSIISETVSLSFGYIAEFILQRTTELANQFWGKAIYCDPPQHFPGVHYYWSRDFFPNFLEEDLRVFVSYDGNLYISAVDTSDTGKYSCNVQSTVSDSGRNGPFFSLQVVPHGNPQQLKFPNNFPKVFPEAPKAGDMVRLECVAFGYPVPSYNWTRKGSGLPRNAILSNYNRVIILKNVSIDDQGEYVCRASNSRLYIESSATLSIQAAPQFNIHLEDMHMDKDADLTWTCEALGIPDVSYQWYKNGQLLSQETLAPPDIGRYFIQDNVLAIRKLDEERDPGMYQCRANNSLAAKFSSAQLRILLLRPDFKKRPVDAEILAMENGNITIKCDPEAAPRPRFQWRKDGNLIGSGGRRVILPSGSLQIKPVSREDIGVYTCIATNPRGTDESSGRLAVLRGPVLMEPMPDRVQYAVGSQLSLRCRADADPSLDISYIWRHNGLRIDESPESIFQSRVRLDPRFGYLEVFNLTVGDKGDYECEVISWVGTLKTGTRVEIRGPPGPPGGVEAFDLSSVNATVRWTDGATNGAAAYLYTIEGRTQWDSTWETLATNVTAFEADRSVGPRVGENLRKETRVIGSLSPWSAYEFRVIAANEFGYGMPSNPSPQYNTLPAKPFRAPQNVGGGGGKTNSLTITWDPLPPKDQNAPGIHYKIFWRRFRQDQQEEEYQSLPLSDWGNLGSYAVSIPSNYYYTLYEVKVQAINDRGRGIISDAVSIYSAEDMPQTTPSVVFPRPHNSTAINVTWAAVDETREKIRGELLGYRIRYWLKKDNNLYDAGALNYLSRSKNPWALIVGLIPNTYYYVQVMAYNSAGPGPASEPIYERTLKKAPQKPPTAVTVTAYDPSTIDVTWRYVAPSVDEEALLGYRIRIWEADQDISTAKDKEVPIGSRKLETRIGGLTPGKTYVLRVLAYSKGGDGKMSSPAKEFILGDPETLRSKATQSIPTLATTFLAIFVLFSYYSSIDN